jgi:2-dehydro-3-deoxyphosphogluconate aldolase/(4S)-4-hydroxy-2-oxoglutarate aldolase
VGSHARQGEEATSNFLAGVRQIGVVAVVTIEDAASTPALVSALLAGGLTHVEITLRTSGAFDALTALSGSGAVLGAGTVTTASGAARAISAGAQFVVSPGLDDGVVHHCQVEGVASGARARVRR